MFSTEKWLCLSTLNLITKVSCSQNDKFEHLRKCFCLLDFVDLQYVIVVQYIFAMLNYCFDCLLLSIVVGSRPQIFE